jgi:hypothetical protein
MASGHVNRAQRSEHMAAPTNPAPVKKTLANSEPSTHGPTPPFVRCSDMSGMCLAECEGADASGRSWTCRCAAATSIAWHPSMADPVRWAPQDSYRTESNPKFGQMHTEQQAMARLRQAKTRVRDLPRQALRIGLIPPGGSTPITPVGVRWSPRSRSLPVQQIQTNLPHSPV